MSTGRRLDRGQLQSSGPWRARSSPRSTESPRRSRPRPVPRTSRAPPPQPGNGTFVDVSRAAGLLDSKGKASGSLSGLRRNGLLDFVVANDTRPNFLFMNRGERASRKSASWPASLTTRPAGSGRMGSTSRTTRAMASGVVWPTSARSPFPFTAGKRTVPSAPRPAGRRGHSDVQHARLRHSFRDLDLDGVQDLIIATATIEPDVNNTFQAQRYSSPLSSSAARRWNVRRGQPQRGARLHGSEGGKGLGPG